MKHAVSSIQQPTDKIIDNSYSAGDALNPAASIFVSANAGAGKTRLLTNRVLRLLLHGVTPSAILCLTFTNAASAEMKSRILKELGSWVMADDAQLHNILARLLDTSPGVAVAQDFVTRARGLFAQVLEAPEGVRIQTIHGFSQSLLRRFPLEAGVAMHFTVIDERTEQELLLEARLRLFNSASNREPVLQESIATMARMVGETGVQELLGEIIKHKRRFHTMLQTAGGVQALLSKLWRNLGVTPHEPAEALVTKHFAYDDICLANLRHVTTLLLAGEKTDRATGQVLADWLSAENKSHALAQAYSAAFTTKEGKPYAQSRLFTKKALEQNTHAAYVLEEQERAMRYLEACKACEVARHSAVVLHIAEALLAIYSELKRERAAMDYDDLIMHACNLLQRPGIAPWVLFKLDGGIDHILVDEAQDTSPEQWLIIDALSQDFFSGETAKELDRSLFIVGDEKQSIYSFQGADPAMLGHMRAYFEARIQDAQKPVHRIALTRSYRSTPQVLQAVDAIFAAAPAREGLTHDNQPFGHTPTLDHAGLVELWPLVLAQDGNSAHHATLLARCIAETVHGWLENGQLLRGRPLTAGDVMVLVRKRTPFVDKLARALKRRGVKVAGVDRMALTDNLAVQDMLALGHFLLLPEDDLTLAALLKSPLCGINEEQLFALAWQRGDMRLWERLRQSPDAACIQAYELLASLRSKTDFLSPYELFSHVLDALGARKRITGRMGEEYNDPLDEFLNQALAYERSHTPSLQGFLHWLDHSSSQIKRDMEQAHDALRIMTIHGAKGLQAPIVILPDTTQPPTPKDTLLWHDAHPLWPVSSKRDDALCRNVRAELRSAMFAEYRRLLYVALTRAEDRLYICGSASKEKLHEHCWYQLVKNGLAPIAQAYISNAGEGLRLGETPECSAYSHADVQDAGNEAGETDASLHFLCQPAPAEPLPPRPLTPSHLGDDAPAAASPLQESSLYQRGNFMHKLLQYMPSVAPAQRTALVSRITAMFAHELPQAVLQEAAREALAIIDNPEFAFLFAENTMAEVPLIGCVKLGEAVISVSGRIDRLCIAKHEIWIIDYKSNRLPPTANRPIPAAYIRQMKLYRSLLQQLYPEKEVHCALLWTAVPKLEVLDHALLD